MKTLLALSVAVFCSYALLGCKGGDEGSSSQTTSNVPAGPVATPTNKTAEGGPGTPGRSPMPQLNTGGDASKWAPGQKGSGGGQ